MYVQSLSFWLALFFWLPHTLQAHLKFRMADTMNSVEHIEVKDVESRSTPPPAFEGETEVAERTGHQEVPFRTDANCRDWWKSCVLHWEGE